MRSEIEMALFEPPVVLPAPMSVGARLVSDISGPRALMLAVLEDAVRCLERGRWRHPRTHRLAAEAEAWVRSDYRDWPFSFANICDALGIDAVVLRVRLLARMENAGPAPRSSVHEGDGHDGSPRPSAER